jgi:hypothetical protein
MKAITEDRGSLRVGIMQPYFLPYVGYFQLIQSVDVFIVYDNIQYTKKGWINRNRMLQNGKDVLFSIPLAKDSDFMNVCDRKIASDFNKDKLLSQISGAYRRAPYFKQTFPLIEQIVRREEQNLFLYIHHSIVKVCEHLGLTTKIKLSSQIEIDHELRSQDKVLALCRAEGAAVYVNAIGGTALYSSNRFQDEGVDLQFVASKPLVYAQFDSEFIPNLSILDVMMFNPTDEIASHIISGYKFVEQ